MKQLKIYDANAANNVDDGVDLLLKIFNDLEVIADSVDYNNEDEKNKYNEYIELIKRYFEKTESLLIDQRDKDE